MKIHHIGYLVKNLDRALRTFQGLGYAVMQEKMFDAERGVDIVFLSKDGYSIELVSPATEGSVVAELVKRFGNNAYHICYETEDLDAEVERLRDEHYVACGSSRPAPALGGRRVIFLINPFLGMIELVEAGR